MSGYDSWLEQPYYDKVAEEDKLSDAIDDQFDDYIFDLLEGDGSAIEFADTKLDFPIELLGKILAAYARYPNVADFGAAASKLIHSDVYKAAEIEATNEFYK